jgi:hypothetical protein
LAKPFGKENPALQFFPSEEAGTEAAGFATESVGGTGFADESVGGTGFADESVGGTGFADESVGGTGFADESVGGAEEVGGLADAVSPACADVPVADGSAGLAGTIRSTRMRFPSEKCSMMSIFPSELLSSSSRTSAPPS